MKRIMTLMLVAFVMFSLYASAHRSSYTLTKTKLYCRNGLWVWTFEEYPNVIYGPWVSMCIRYWMGGWCQETPNWWL